MTYLCFDVKVSNQVALVTFSRPEKRNSMIPAFWSELPKLIKELDASGRVRAIVLSSTGPHFSTGMDISVFTEAATSDKEQDPAQRPARFYDMVRQMQASFNCLEQARVPVLAAIQGACIGAGVDLVSACDMRYASRDAFFTIYETNLAMTADVGTFPRLCKLIPDGMVRELAYTGRPLSADSARELGLVNSLYDTQEQMLEAVMDIAATIASKAPLAVHGCKKMILHARDHSVADTLEHVAVWNAGFFQHQEVAEAMRAEKEKRPGRFTSLPDKTLNDDEDNLTAP